MSYAVDYFAVSYKDSSGELREAVLELREDSVVWVYDNELDRDIGQGFGEAERRRLFLDLRRSYAPETNPEIKRIHP